MGAEKLGLHPILNFPFVVLVIAHTYLEADCWHRLLT